MSNLTTVTVTAGVPTAGTGTVSTLDNLLGTAGTPSANVQSVQGVAGGTAVPVSLTSTTITGTVAATQSGTWNVTNISGTISLPTGAATSANQPTNAAQGSTTSGQTGALTMGAVTTASPTYTTAQTSPLSLDTAGNLRVNVVAGGAGGGIVTQATAANLNATVQLSDGTHAGTIKAASTAPVATDTALVVAISPNSVNANGQATMAASAPVTVASNQATLSVALDTSQVANGASGTMLTPTKVKISIASATTTTLVALVASKKIRVLSMYLVSAAANTVTLQSHTTTANSDGGLSYAANGGISLPFNPIGWFDTTAGEALDMVTSGAGQVSGVLSYVAV